MARSPVTVDIVATMEATTETIQENVAGRPFKGASEEIVFEWKGSLVEQWSLAYECVLSEDFL